MKNLKKIREQKGFSQKEFAKLCGIAASRYNHYENGIRQPDLQTIEQIADNLEISIDELFGRTPPNKILTPTFSEHEQKLIQAYRSMTHYQIAVDIILGIENDETIDVYQAALSKDNHPDGITQMKKKRWDELTDAPETKDPLI